MMVKILLNGEEREVNSRNIGELLELFGINAERVVVEHNYNIVDRNEYFNTPIRNGDKIEIVCFVGGG